MKLKSTLFAGVLAASLAVPAFANDAVPSVDALPQFTAADTQMLFEQDAMPMQLAALSPQEMRETEGSFIWNGVIGGAIGLGTYAYNNWGNMTWGGALGSTALGVVSGYGVGSLVKVIGPYSSGGWGVAVNRGLSNPFRLQSNARQAVRFNFNGFKPTTVHHRLNGTGFNRHSTYSNFFRSLFLRGR